MKSASDKEKKKKKKTVMGITVSCLGYRNHGLLYGDGIIMLHPEDQLGFKEEE